MLLSGYGKMVMLRCFFLLRWFLAGFQILNLQIIVYFSFCRCNAIRRTYFYIFQSNILFYLCMLCRKFLGLMLSVILNFELFLCSQSTHFAVKVKVFTANVNIKGK